MIDAGAVIAQLRTTDERSGGWREAWREPWVAERRRLDELARAASPDVLIEHDAFANTWYVLPGESNETVLVLAQSGIPTAMLFVPSIDGVSHARAEDTPEADLAAGIMALDTLIGRLADG
jgi:hypothetical protein